MKKRDKFKKLLIIIIIVLAVILVVGLISINLLNNLRKNSNLEGELGTYSPTASTDSSLRAHYKFEGNALDSQGRYDGTIYGNKEFVSGKCGKALNFDGTRTYVYLGNVMTSDIKSAFTIGAWIKLSPGALQKPLNYIFHKYDDRPGIRISSNGKVYYCKWGGGTGACIASSTTITEETWYYISYTFDGTTHKGYINGQLVGSILNSVGTKYYPGSTIRLGRDEKSVRYNRYFKGAMDEVKIWNRALTPSEIIREYTTFDTTLDITRSIIYVRGFRRRRAYRFITLNIVSSDLDDNEIMIIAEQIPDGGIIVQDSWNIEPTYNFDNTLVWLFANNPIQTLGQETITEEIPSSITYQVSGTSSNEFKGKWGLEIVNIDGLITGDNTL